MDNDHLVRSSKSSPSYLFFKYIEQLLKLFERRSIKQIPNKTLALTCYRIRILLTKTKTFSRRHLGKSNICTFEEPTNYFKTHVNSFSHQNEESMSLFCRLLYL